jgi:hypothetical protein
VRLTSIIYAQAVLPPQPFKTCSGFGTLALEVQFLFLFYVLLMFSVSSLLSSATKFWPLMGSIAAMDNDVPLGPSRGWTSSTLNEPNVGLRRRDGAGGSSDDPEATSK